MNIVVCYDDVLRSFYNLYLKILYVKDFRIFLLSFEKERRKTLQKEERKTVVSQYGSLKTRSHKQARGFRNTVSPENAPAIAFSV